MTHVLQTARPLQLASCSGDFAVDAVQGAIELRDLAKGSSREIYQVGEGQLVADAAISHDGRSVAFTASAFQAGFYGTPTAIRIVSNGGGAAREIASATAPAELQYSSLTWSPDDRFVYFTRRPDAHLPFELYRVSAAGGTPESMGLKLDGLRDIDVAPDGIRLAFSLGSGGTQVWAVRGFLPARK